MQTRFQKEQLFNIRRKTWAEQLCDANAEKRLPHTINTGRLEQQGPRT